MGVKKIKKLIHKFLNNQGYEISKVGYRSFMWYVNTYGGKIHHADKPKGLTGVEIGTWKGDNAERMLKYMDIKKIYLVDPYKMSEDYSDEWGGEVITQELLNDAEIQAKINLPKSQCVFIKKSSGEAVKKIPSDLDFVYIDGNHSYEAVTEDITNYYPKVKDGGIIGGHNINYWSVLTAVVDYCRLNGIKNLHCRGEDWMILKEADNRESSSKEVEECCTDNYMEWIKPHTYKCCACGKIMKFVSVPNTDSPHVNTPTQPRSKELSSDKTLEDTKTTLNADYTKEAGE